MGNTVRESLIRHPSTQKLTQISLWSTLFSSLLGLIGIVMVGIEMAKLQDSVINAVSLVGLILLLLSVMVTYILFYCTAFVYHQFSTVPAMVCSNVLYALIGIALLIVAEILPVSKMFANVLINEDKLYIDANKHLLLKLGETSTAYPEYTLPSLGYQDKERLIWVRLNIYGGCLLGVGIIGAVSSLYIMCRLYAKQQLIKSQELARRRLSRNTWNRSHSIENMSRVHVYDYTAWGNRTKDLYRNRVGKKAEHETKNLNGILKGSEHKKNANPFSSLGTASFILKNAVLCGSNGGPDQKTENETTATAFNSVDTDGIIMRKSELSSKKEIKLKDGGHRVFRKYEAANDVIPIHPTDFDYVHISPSLHKAVV